MKYITYFFAALCCFSLLTVSCSDDSDVINKYGEFDNNIVATGEADSIQYTTAQLFGKVDMTKASVSNAKFLYIRKKDVKPEEVEQALRYGAKGVSSVYAKALIGNRNNGVRGKLTYLQPAEEYYYRLMVQAGSTEYYGKISTFSTTNPESELVCETLSATDITTSEALLKAKIQIPNLPYIKADAISYGFSYTKSSGKTLDELIKDELFDQTVTANTFDGKEVSYKANYLLRNTKYDYVAYLAINGKKFYAKRMQSFTTSNTTK